MNHEKLNLRSLQHAPSLRGLCRIVALSEELHFAKTAERISVTSSNLSRAVSHIEERLGVKLFVRTRKSTQLTEAGRAFVDDVKGILEQLAVVMDKIRRRGSGLTDSLRVAQCEGLSHPRIAKLLESSCRDEPKVKISLEKQSDHIDIVFVAATDRPVLSDPRLDAVPLWQDPLVLVMSGSHPLAGQSQVQSLAAYQETIYSIEALEHVDLSDVSFDRRSHECEIHAMASVEHVLAQVAFSGSLGLLSAAQVETIKRDDIVIRPLATKSSLTTYLVHQQECHLAEARGALVKRFVERAKLAADAKTPPTPRVNGHF